MAVTGWSIGGNNINILDNTVIRDKKCGTVYGAQECSYGIHEWKFLIEELSLGMFGEIAIGIISNTKHLNAWCCNKMDGHHCSYTYHSNGSKTSHAIVNQQYLSPFKIGNIIHIKLDLENGILSFSNYSKKTKNNKHKKLKVAFSDVVFNKHSTKYRVAVSFSNYGSKCQIKMISYSNNLDKFINNNDEKKEEINVNIIAKEFKESEWENKLTECNSSINHIESKIHYYNKLLIVERQKKRKIIEDMENHWSEWKINDFVTWWKMTLTPKIFNQYFINKNDAILKVEQYMINKFGNGSTQHLNKYLNKFTSLSFNKIGITEEKECDILFNKLETIVQISLINDDIDDSKKLKQFLKKEKLEKYFKDLYENGYQDIQSLQMCYNEFKNDDKLMIKETGIDSLIHRKKLLKAIGILIINKNPNEGYIHNHADTAWI